MKLWQATLLAHKKNTLSDTSVSEWQEVKLKWAEARSCRAIGQVLDGLISRIMTGVVVERRTGHHLLNSFVIRVKGL